MLVFNDFAVCAQDATDVMHTLLEKDQQEYMSEKDWEVREADKRKAIDMLTDLCGSLYVSLAVRAVNAADARSLQKDQEMAEEFNV